MSRLTCTQADSMLLDAADDLLLPEELAHFELHLAECSNCARSYAELKQGSAWLDVLKAAPPVPPSDLVNRILFRTSGDAAASAAFRAEAAHTASLFGDSRTNVLPFAVPAHLQASRTRMQRIVHTAMQPRFAMTAAMTFFSIALSMNLAGVRLNSLRLSQLTPTNLKKRYWAANSRVVQYYDNLRVVYELESRVREMQRESDDPTPQRGLMSRPAPEQPQRSVPTGTPHSSVSGAHRTVAAYRAVDPSPTVGDRPDNSLHSEGKGELA